MIVEVEVDIDVDDILSDLGSDRVRELMLGTLATLDEEEAADLMATLAGRLESHGAISAAIEGRDWIRRVDLLRYLADRMPEEFRAAGLAQVETA